MLVCRVFSFSRNVFKRPLPPGRKNQGLFSAGLTAKGTCCFDSRSTANKNCRKSRAGYTRVVYTTTGVVSSIHTFEILNADWSTPYMRGLIELNKHNITFYFRLEAYSSLSNNTNKFNTGVEAI